MKDKGLKNGENSNIHIYSNSLLTYLMLQLSFQLRVSHNATHINGVLSTVH